MRPQKFSDEQLLLTARRCFLEHGPSSPTSRIAAELGVSEAALFKRVGSKRQLLIRALAVHEPPWFDEVRAGPDGRPLQAQLLDLARSMDRFFVEAAPRFAVLRAGGIEPSELCAPDEDAPPIVAHRLLTAWFSRAGERNLAQVRDASAVALLLLSSVVSRCTMRHVLGVDYPQGGPDYLASLVDTICFGITPAPDHGMSSPGISGPEVAS